MGSQHPLTVEGIEAHRAESDYQRAIYPHLHRVVSGHGGLLEVHDVIVSDPFHGFIPGRSATLPRCRQFAYCVSKNNPGLRVRIERLCDGVEVAAYRNGREV